MTVEQNYFLMIISDHLGRRKSKEPPLSINWNSLFQIARIHQLDGILFFQCKRFLPEEIRSILEERFGSTLYLSANRGKIVARLFDSLDSEKIEHFEIKGSAVASYYPFPVLRTMGDTDIVVHTEDRQRVHEILLSQGFENVSSCEVREWVYLKNQMEFEIHDHLIYEETINRNVHEEFFEVFWQFVKDGELDWNFHFLFILLHLRKHLMNCGVGFRQFIDVAVVTKNNKQLDWSWIEEKLIWLDMLEFARTVFALNNAWFGIKSPIMIKEIDDDFYLNATEQVFNNGVFGFNNDDNKDNYAVNIVRENSNRKLAMLCNAISKVFPSYKSLIIIPHYSFLKGKKWLLPVAWIYRLYRGVKNKHVSRGMKLVKTSFTSNETIEKRSEWLEKWGL